MLTFRQMYKNEHQLIFITPLEKKKKNGCKTALRFRNREIDPMT